MKDKLNTILKSGPIKFLQGGIALKIVSFGLNYVMADVLGLHKEATYFFILVIDLLFGYLINRYFVFSETQKESNQKVFKQFLIAGLSFRALNWGIYVLIIQKLDFYILTAQFIATAIVLVLKYFIYKKIFK